ncbi:MAG: methyltransferase domain-containing protein [Betaproteobacteria bacterium]|nr:methyltransferase domain-containing protein [Betaproteobacteria bacterium]
MSIPGVDAWLASPLGQYVLRWEQAQFDQIVADVFGYNALQVGLWQCDLLRANRIPFRFRCDSNGSADVVDAYCRLQHLPFATSSIDLVVLPHVLEFVEGAHQILREVERVLVPEGHVVISGFNPYSFWGLRRALARTRSVFPWTGKYISVMRLRDWLSLLGFESRAGAFGCYLPAVSGDRWLRRAHWVELAGRRWWPVAGGVYLLHAVKRVQGMRVITPAWRHGKTASRRLAPMVQRDGQK